ncbi:MAG: hypothetical protein A4E43_00792 [Methanosaeta sp. PtaB.Bin005]|nr:MAG: hypothetical protein A4E43_00792 [Methanosaeta sp. PtaB.Bin005]
MMREISSRVSPGWRARSDSLPTAFPSRSLIFIPCSWLKKLTRLNPFVAASLTQRGPVAVIFSAMPLDVRHISPQFLNSSISTAQFSASLICSIFSMHPRQEGSLLSPDP